MKKVDVKLRNVYMNKGPQHHQSYYGLGARKPDFVSCKNIGAGQYVHPRKLNSAFYCSLLGR